MRGGRPRNELTTGVFYHPSFSRRSYLTIGNRLKDFPGILDDIVRAAPIRMYTSPRIKKELLLKVHHPEMIALADREPLCSTARESAGGVVMAAEEIWKGHLRNAFAFIGAGGHHAGYDFFGGACCFNDVVAAVVRLRELNGKIKVAILDTDAHHGDGTRMLLENDPGILHCCVCSMDYISADGLKMDIQFLGRNKKDPDEAYFRLVEKHFGPAMSSFGADFLFWYFGFDTHRLDYGSVGLTGKAYFDLTRWIVQLSGKYCNGKLEVVLAGGSRPDLASDLIPPVISELARG